MKIFKLYYLKLGDKTLFFTDENKVKEFSKIRDNKPYYNYLIISDGKSNYVIDHLESSIIDRKLEIAKTYDKLEIKDLQNLGL